MCSAIEDIFGSDPPERSDGSGASPGLFVAGWFREQPLDQATTD
jgi:hypothetical protein